MNVSTSPTRENPAAVSPTMIAPRNTTIIKGSGLYL
jgi:hypothetical protein